MSRSPVCLGCGTLLGDKRPFYNAVLQNRMEKKGLTTFSHAAFSLVMASFDAKSRMGDVLDALGLDKSCCRTEMISSITIVDFTEYSGANVIQRQQLAKIAETTTQQRM